MNKTKPSNLKFGIIEMIENSSRGEAEAAEGSRQKAHYSMDEFCE
jgi:hypothetical protein